MNWNIKTAIVAFVIVAALVGYKYVPTGAVTVSTVSGAGDFKLYKSPGCGCCSGYVSYLGENGITADVKETDVESLKTKYGIPRKMQSCHTSFVGKYFVEGHVPIEAVNKLMKQQPDIKGIALPGMPAGAAGMHGDKKQPFIVYAVNNDGSTETFMEV